MLDIVRLTLTIVLFCMGLYFIYSLFANGFSFLVLTAAIACFVLAHYTKPKRSNSDDWASCRPFKGDIDGFDL